MSVLSWTFPLPRVHTGIELANGVFGVSVWGDERLHLTIARSGFWDRRGVHGFAARTTYRAVVDLLAAGREAEVYACAGPVDSGDLGLGRPWNLPGGRLELTLGTTRPRSATLSEDGRLHIRCADGSELVLAVAMADRAPQTELLWIELPPALRGRVQVRMRPAWEWLRERYTAAGIPAPEKQEGLCVQRLPRDPALAIAWADRGAALTVATALGDPAAATATCRRELAPLHAASAAWWQQYWRDVPRLELPDADLSRLHRYGLVKQAGLTTPGGVAATLQGPWMEEDQLPPWSNDYHFNVNVQLCYWSALSSNRAGHLAPLWDMIATWLPKLQSAGQRFFGASDALIFPHACTDGGEPVDAFWHGTIDVACAAWMGRLAWLHGRHTGERDVLERIAWPLLAGAFGSYWAMAERRDGTLSFPVSVSPEWGEGQPGMHGRDASFQLAAAHQTARLLTDLAARLDRPVDPRWAELDRDLPAYSAEPIPTGPWEAPGSPRRHRIGIWQGQDLTTSHRHHSHLAGVYPFATLDPHEPTVANGIGHWWWTGPGAWCGWCLPWAATLCARTGRSDAAVIWLRWLNDNYANEGGNLSIGGIDGAQCGWGGWYDARRSGGPEIMQLDANLGVVEALHELFVQDHDGELRVMPQVPVRWPQCAAYGIAAPGGFLVDAQAEEGRLQRIRIVSRRGEVLRLRLPTAGWQHAGATLAERATMATTPGQMLELTAPRPSAGA
jgi:alpha-L-fucosidase 2